MIDPLISVIVPVYNIENYIIEIGRASCRERV